MAAVQLDAFEVFPSLAPPLQAGRVASSIVGPKQRCWLIHLALRARDFYQLGGEPRDPVGSKLCQADRQIVEAAVRQNGSLLSRSDTEGGLWLWEISTGDGKQPFSSLQARSALTSFVHFVDESFLLSNTPF